MHQLTGNYTQLYSFYILYSYNTHSKRLLRHYVTFSLYSTFSSYNSFIGIARGALGTIAPPPQESKIDRAFAATRQVSELPRAFLGLCPRPCWGSLQHSPRPCGWWGRGMMFLPHSRPRISALWASRVPPKTNSWLRL